ncbi:MAG: (d)CMP kinase [Filifactor alocis]|nr:(d)CMP kinase [Filifactor alocis]
MIIAIDGPSGSGKSTIAKELAEKFQFLYIDTGSMYRALTLGYLEEGADLESEDTRRRFLERMHVSFDTKNRICLNGREVAEEIRSIEVTQAVSYVSAFADIRKKMVELQREFAKENSVVMDGRDIGTTVFPEAEVKIFLIADVQERARRRWNQMREKGIETTLEEVETELRIRDEKDSNRKVSPLRKAEDAVEVDTTSLTVEEVIEKIGSIVQRRSLCTH